MNIFDEFEAQQEKERGMEKAAKAREELLFTARDIAVKIAKAKGTVTADDVGKEMHRLGYNLLGPAAGSLFKLEIFEFTGEFVESSKKSNHGRLLRVWRLR